MPLCTTLPKKTRKILGLRRYDHTHDDFVNLILLKLKEINTYCCGSFILRNLNSPEKDLFSYRINERCLERNNNTLNVSFVGSELSKPSITYRGPTVWFPS